jgi:hypothetical protein
MNPSSGLHKIGWGVFIAMWILKGTLLGLWLLGFGTMAWLYFVIYRNLPPNSAVEIGVITGSTVQDPV